MIEVNLVDEEKEDSMFMNRTGKYDTGIQKESSGQRMDVLEKKVSDFHFSVSSRLDMMEKMFTDQYPHLPKEAQTINIQVKPHSQTNPKDIRSPQSSYLTELYNSISLPGMRYIASREPTLHRLLWIFIHTVAFLISYTYIQAKYDEWQSSQVVRSAVVTSVVDIPFPAVTLCRNLSLNSGYDRKKVRSKCISFEDVKNPVWICSNEELKMFTAATFISPVETVNTVLAGFTSLQGITQREQSVWFYHNLKENLTAWKGSEILEYIRNISDYNEDAVNPFVDTIFAKGVSEFILSRKYRSKHTWSKCYAVNDMSHRFFRNQATGKTATATDYGSKDSFCTPENILENVCKTTYFSENQELKLNRVSYKTLYDLCLHSHWSGNWNCKWFDFSTDYTKSAVIIPKLRYARRDLKELSISIRDCLFSFERRLVYYDFYTQENCYLDCKINCALEMCGCVPMELAFWNSSFDFCSLGRSYGCFARIGMSLPASDKHQACYCDCPPDCASLTYDIEISDGPKDLYNLFWFLFLRYKEPEFISEYRYSSTSPAEFLAYSMGILGVFNGFSLMLVWEILYWLTLRLWHHIKRYQHYYSSD